MINYWFGEAEDCLDLGHTHQEREKEKMSPCRILVKFPVTPHFLKAVVILLLLLLEILIQWQFLSPKIGSAIPGNAASEDSSEGQVGNTYSNHLDQLVPKSLLQININYSVQANR